MFPTEKHINDFAQDKFKYEELSKRLIDNILLQMELPNCFGLYGNWGTGKSSLIHFILKHLNEKKEYAEISPIYFEPWKYEYSDQKDFLYALLRLIKKSFGMNNKVWKRLLVDAIAISTGLLKNFNVDLQSAESDIKTIENEVFAEYELWIDQVEKFQTSFTTIIAQGLKKVNKTKLIIFIDDLDRCLPENAIKLIEAIKNFLSVENTLFVIAIDKRVVAEMIQSKFGLHQGYGEEYLMKIIHYNYELPAPDLNCIIEEVFASYNLVVTKNQLETISSFFKYHVKEVRVSKHYLHQFCMKIILTFPKKRIDKILKKNYSFEFLFIASFVLSKYSYLFTGSKSSLTQDIIEKLSELSRASQENYDFYRAKLDYVNSDDLSQLLIIVRNSRSIFKEDTYVNEEVSWLLQAISALNNK